MDLQYTD